MVTVRSIIVVAVSASACFASPLPPDAEIRKILADRVGADNIGIGLVVGVIDANGRRIVSYGSLAKDDKRPLSGDTVFEIGSMTKVFTSLVLMDMVQKGEVALDDPVAKYLPESVKVPERNGRKITLRDLSTQTSGLPRMPSNFHPKVPDNPYADYSPALLYEFLSGYQLTRDIGEKYEYSNLGVGLLGHALSLRAGKDYETMVRSRILDPLEMTSTRVAFTADMKARLAVGHSATLAPVANWDLAALAGAGALRSTANDVLKFLAANLGYTRTPLAAAMAKEVSVQKPTGLPNTEIAYAWHITTKDGNTIVWHNGGTGGYRTFMGFDPKSRQGVVVLSNIANEGPDDIGRHLLDASYPLASVTPPKEHKEVTLDPKSFEKYVGSYQLGPNAVLAVSRDGDKLYAQLTGQPKFQIFPEGEKKFFLKVVDAQITFDTDAEGKPTQAVLHQAGRDMPAKRIDDAAAAAVAAALAKRVKDQTALPGSEAAVRNTLEDVRAGHPKYETMSPGLAEATRQQLTQIQAMLGQLGALASITFKGVGPGGADIYELKFEHGSLESRIMLEADGKIASLGYRAI